MLLAFVVVLAPHLAFAADTQAPAIFLVAKPELTDPNFYHSVVLVVFPREGGPMGVILNRPLEITAKQAFPEDEQLKSRDDPLYMGGPVRNTALFYLFRSATAPDTALHVLDDLCFSGNGELMDQLLVQPSQPILRMFLGFSGWTDEQLEQEIRVGAWHTIEADLDTILKEDPKTLWRKLIVRATATKI